MVGYGSTVLERILAVRLGYAGSQGWKRQDRKESTIYCLLLGMSACTLGLGIYVSTYPWSRMAVRTLAAEVGRRLADSAQCERVPLIRNLLRQVAGRLVYSLTLKHRKHRP